MADLRARVTQLLNRFIGVSEIDFEHRVPLQAQRALERAQCFKQVKPGVLDARIGNHFTTNSTGLSVATAVSSPVPTSTINSVPRIPIVDDSVRRSTRSGACFAINPLTTITVPFKNET